MLVTPEIIKYFTQLGIKPELVEAGSERLTSDLAIACFTMADQSQSPEEVAKKLTTSISHPAFTKVEASGGYVNVWLKSSYILEALQKSEVAETNFGSQASNNQTVIIDYVGANIAKPLTVGHLKNALQGRALVNLYRSQGYTVVTDNHLGDWGTVFGIWVVGFEKFSNQKKLESGGLEELGRAYIKAKQALQAEADQNQDSLAKVVQDWLLKLEANDEQALAYHRRFREISLEGIQKVLDQLEIEFDETLGESFYQPQVKKLLKQLEVSGIAQRQSDNSLVVDLSSQGIDTPLLIQKSNGAGLYASSDIATLKYRQERWQPSQIIYVVGHEQRLHFRQIFAFNNLADYTSAELIHHSYGLVEELDESGKRRKLSSRRGAVSLESILETARSKAEELAKLGMDKEDIERVALGAITFREFSQSSTSNVLFDWQEMFSLTGFSGPYVQYAAVRLGSILKKADQSKTKLVSNYDWQAEHPLLMSLLRYPDTLQTALINRDVYKIAFHIYDLAKKLNRYYEQTTVLVEDQDTRGSRLWLMRVLYQHFEHALGILGMKIPKKM